MTLERSHEGQPIQFFSEKNGYVECMLLSIGRDNIQVELLHDIKSGTRFWVKGDVRLFDIDKINDISLIENYRAPEKKKDTERKQKQSKKKLPLFGSKMTYHESELQRIYTTPSKINADK
jgi:hypothetical protein